MDKIKIVFFDIDGTILPVGDENFPIKITEAINKLHEKNIRVCLATGRAPVQFPDLSKVHIDTILAFNGSLCFDKNEDIFTNPLKKEDVLEIIKNAQNMGKPLGLAGKDRYLVNYYNDDLKEFFSFGDFVPELNENIEEFAQNKKIYQMLMPIMKKDYDKALECTDSTKITAWWDRAVDIIPKNGGKGQGVREVLSFYGINKNEALAFGDGGNDIEMFEAIRGVAVENASKDLKEKAVDICGSVDDFGVYYYLKDKGIIG